MADLAPWPDPHDILIELFGDLTMSQVVGPLLYPEFQEDMPLIRVRKVGGVNDKLTSIDRMAVDVYAATYVVARDLAEACRQRLFSYPHRTSVGRLDRAETESSWAEVPWSDPNTRYLTAIYRISARR